MVCRGRFVIRGALGRARRTACSGQGGDIFNVLEHPVAPDGRKNSAPHARSDGPAAKSVEVLHAVGEGAREWRRGHDAGEGEPITGRLAKRHDVRRDPADLRPSAGR